MIRSDSGVRSTNAREVTISATYRPPPFSRHSRRNAALVMPAIGASTTGVSTTSEPMRSGGRTGAAEVVTWVILPQLNLWAARAAPGRGIADGLPPAVPTAATASEQRSGPDEPRREVGRDLVERDAVL